MENKISKNLTIPRKMKLISLKSLDKPIQVNNHLSQSTKLNMINQLSLNLTPSNNISRNTQKNILFDKQINETERRASKIKLFKKKNEYILPYLSFNKNNTSNTLFHNSIKSSEKYSNSNLQSDYLKNKNITNSFKSFPKVQKNKIQKVGTTYFINNSTNMSDNNNINENINNNKNNNINHKINEEIKINKKIYNFTQNEFYQAPKEEIFNSPQKKLDTNIVYDKPSIDKYLNSKNGIFRVSDFNYKLLCKNVKTPKPVDKKKENRKEIINKIKNHSLFSEIKKENDLMKKIIRKKYTSLDELKTKLYLKRPNEETYDGYYKLFYKYNKKRSKKQNIVTNRLIPLNNAGDNNLQNIDYKELIDNMEKEKYNNILFNSKGEQIFNERKNKKKRLNEFELTNFASRANRKVEKIFPDIIGFNLPKIFHDNKEYTLKLFYDVFIEFKTLLKLCILYNNDINIHNKGIDFKTFFNCNTKINQQGEGLAKKFIKL